MYICKIVSICVHLFRHSISDLSDDPEGWLITLTLLR